MENKTGNLISSLRKNLCFSQEELAEKTSLNLRTIQRIESGNTVPRGYTLRAIADALGIPISDLTAQNNAEQEEKTNAPTLNKGFLLSLNFLSLTYWACPFLNIIVPLAVFLHNPNKSAADRRYGARVINFQITWTIITYSLMIWGAFNKITHRSGIIPADTLLMVAVLLYAANTLIILVTIFMLNRNSKINWLWAIPVIR